MNQNNPLTSALAICLLLILGAFTFLVLFMEAEYE